MEKGTNKETINWQIHEDPEQTLEIVQSLEGALGSKDVNQVQKILQDPENLRSLIQRRGEKNLNYDLLEKGFYSLFQEKFGPSDIFHQKGEDVIDFIHEYDLPEQILIEYLDLAFQRRDRALLNRLATIILENEEKINNKSIIAAVLHNIASWKASQEKNISEAVDYNKKALTAANSAGDEKLAEKIKYGLTFSKDLKPKDKIRGFEQIVSTMEVLDHNYDAMRARIDEAIAHIELAKRQKNTKQDSERKDHLDLALDLIKTAHNYSLFKKIPNLEVMSLDAFALLYEELGDKTKANRNMGKAQAAREKYQYLTKRA